MVSPPTREPLTLELLDTGLVFQSNRRCSPCCQRRFRAIPRCHAPLPDAMPGGTMPWSPVIQVGLTVVRRRSVTGEGVFCPKCGCEFRAGFQECSDCAVPLVESAPVLAQPDHHEFQLVTVFQSGDPALIALAHSLLESAEIPFETKGDGLQDLFGWGRMPGAFSLFAGPVEFQVNEEDADEARALFEDLGSGKTGSDELDSQPVDSHSSLGDGFQSESDDGFVPENAQAVPAFSPADGAARWTKGLLAAILVLAVAGIVGGLLEIKLLSRAAAEGISDAEALANDSRQAIIRLLQILASLGTAVAFLMWFRRVHRNLPSLGGRELKYTPGWAVGGFFVPFLNCVRPLQVMREVWHGSDPSGIARDTAPSGPAIRNQLGTPAWIAWWWGLLLISSVLASIVMRWGLAENQTIGQLQVLSSLLVLSDLLDVPAALVAIRLVGRITGWQAERRVGITQGTGETTIGNAAGGL